MRFDVRRLHETAPGYLTDWCSRCNDHRLSNHQYAVISLYDGLEHTLLTAHSLLQDLLLGTHFQPASGTFAHTLLSVATQKLVCLVALDN